MKWLLSTILELFFPQSADEKNVAFCTTTDFVQKICPVNINSVITLISFSDVQIRAAIHLNKFHRYPHARRLLGSVLHEWLQRHTHTQYVLIPIPLSSHRQRSRGYNQVTEIIQVAIQGCSNVTLHTDILVRTRNTKPQTKCTKEDRLRNVVGAFDVPVHAQRKLRGMNILLVDDVATTGATLFEAKTALMRYKPKSVTCVAIAH